MKRPSYFLTAMLIIAAGLFMVSLMSPAMICRYGATRSGVEILEYGWAGLLVLDPRWYANPMAVWLIFRMLLAKSGRLTLGLSTLMLLCVIASPLFPSYACGGGAGGPELSTGLASGGYYWMVSMGLLVLCGFVAGLSATIDEPGKPSAHRKAR